jgi:hypothetical protein
MRHSLISKALGACLLMALASSAWAIPISDVGSIDTLLGSTALSNSSEANETAWASSILGFDVTFESKIDGSAAWAAVDSNPGVYAIDFGADGNDPAYFLVKTGAGSSVGPGDTHFLFENLASFRYGVVSLADIGFTTLMVGKISHATQFDDTTRVPEPATSTLFGLGLAGLAIVRRRSLMGALRNRFSSRPQVV